MGHTACQTQQQMTHQFLDYQTDTSRARVAVSKEIVTAEGMEVGRAAVIWVTGCLDDQLPASSCEAICQGSSAASKDRIPQHYEIKENRQSFDEQ